jgi:hypothetical protein
MQYSILDLCAVDAFTIFIGNSPSWKAGLLQVLQTLEVGKVKCNVLALGTDFELMNGERWLCEMPLNAGDSVVVRPDQHILLVMKSDMDVEDVTSSILRYLGLY